MLKIQKGNSQIRKGRRRKKTYFFGGFNGPISFPSYTSVSLFFGCSFFFVYISSIGAIFSHTLLCLFFSCFFSFIYICLYFTLFFRTFLGVFKSMLVFCYFFFYRYTLPSSDIASPYHPTPPYIFIPFFY